MALDDAQLRSIIESILVISPDPVPVARLVEVVRIEDPETDASVVKSAVAQLLEDYTDLERPVARGFRVEEVAGGLQLRTVADNALFVRRFLAAKPQRLSKAALETLSIIAYRQPVTKPEVEAVRGVDAGAALRSLLERDLVKIVGKKEEVGRPLIYGTTPYFLDFFSLKGLTELPTLKEFHELDESSLEEVSQMEGAPSVQELAEAAQFLVEREHDPDLEALDAAVKAADEAKAAAAETLDPTPPESTEADSEDNKVSAKAKSNLNSDEMKEVSKGAKREKAAPSTPAPKTKLRKRVKKDAVLEASEDSVSPKANIEVEETSAPAAGERSPEKLAEGAEPDDKSEVPHVPPVESNNSAEPAAETGPSPANSSAQDPDLEKAGSIP